MHSVRFSKPGVTSAAMCCATTSTRAQPWTCWSWLTAQAQGGVHQGHQGSARQGCAMIASNQEGAKQRCYYFYPMFSLALHYSWLSLLLFHVLLLFMFSLSITAA
jgi:hypothetical protein